MANEFIIKNGFHSKGDSQITGSLSITGGSSGSFSGSFQGDGSSLTGVGAFPFTGDAQITGSLTVSGSFNSLTTIFTNTSSADISNFVLGSGSAPVLESGGTYNTIIGVEAGQGLSTGDKNVIIGYQAGKRDINTETNNVIIGYQAGQFADCTTNILIGDRAGMYGDGGSGNIYIGQLAGAGHSSDVADGDYNVAIGLESLRMINTGQYNTALGYNSGNDLTTGHNNIFIGHTAGESITTGGNNIFIGSGSVGTTDTEAQLRIGNGIDIVIISGSLVTGDIIFPSTASAQYYTTPAGQISTISSSYALTASHALNAGGGGGGGIFNQTGSIYSTTNDLQITGSLFVTQLTASSVDIESLPLINPIVEYYNTTVVTSSGTTVSLPNSLTFVSSSTYEYLEVFINGLRMRYDMDFIPATTASVTYQVTIPSGSEVTYKSLKRP